MSCKEFQQQVYLYRELTPSEKKVLDKHLSMCDACNKLMDQISRVNSLMQQENLFKPEVKNPHLLTERIMRAITTQQESNVLDDVIAYLHSYLVRSAVSLVSIVLVSFFVYEQQLTGIQTNEKASPQPISRGTRLDMKDFLDTYWKRREKRQAEPSNSRYAYYKSQKAEIKL